MEKNKKIVLAVIVLAAIAIAGYFLFFQAPPFDQEYKRMALSWKNNGLAEERLHAAYNALLLDPQALGKIRQGLVSFKSNTGNQAAKDLSDVYINFVDFCSDFSSGQAIWASIPESPESPCENIEQVKQLGQKFKGMKEKSDAYLESVKGFVAKHPKEAEQILMYETDISNDQQGIDTLIAINDLVVTEGCK